MKFSGKSEEYFEMCDLHSSLNESGQKEGVLSIIWFEEDDNIIYVDEKRYIVPKDAIISYTWLHKIRIERASKAKCIRFNSQFYCILDHDSEVSCKGILFFGSKHFPIINLEPKDQEVLDSIWKMLSVELQSVDNLQLEMLQMMLKRVLIILTRIYKNQGGYESIENTQVDIVREFNFLVEQYFREKHTVSEYAQLLNKSPKTLSNLFGKVYHKTPLQLIQERKMLEARRLLRYTDKAISDVAHHIGFKDIQSFSRFFKKHETKTPTDFRMAST